MMIFEGMGIRYLTLALPAGRSASRFEEEGESKKKNRRKRIEEEGQTNHMYEEI